MKSIQSKGDNNLKGLLSLYNYIYDIKNTHSNHQHKGHQVVGFEKVNNRDKILRNFANIQQKMDLNHSLKQGKKASGRKSSYGSSILLSLPNEIKLENKDYKKIRDLILIKLIDLISQEYNLNYSAEQRNKYITNYILSTVHLQPNSNNHINILIPNVFIDYNNNNQLIRANLGKKKISYSIKQNFNSIMKEHFNKNYLDYEIKQSKKNIVKNKVSQYSHKLQQVEQQKQTLKQQIEQINRNTNESIKKIEKRVSTYLLRMDTAIEEQNKDKFDKNKLLVNKNIEKLKQSLSTVINTDETLTNPNLSKFENIKKELEKSYTISNPTLQR
jgi:hypothetical protein